MMFYMIFPADHMQQIYLTFSDNYLLKCFKDLSSLLFYLKFPWIDHSGKVKELHEYLKDIQAKHFKMSVYDISTKKICIW